MIELTDWLKAELVRRAEREAPLEACGVISAHPGPSDRQGSRIGLWEARNAAQEPETSFVLDPAEQMRILTRIWEGGEDIVGIYHSHPHSSAKPSERDRLVARSHLVPVTWVIVGLGQCTTCGGAGDVPGAFDDYTSGGLMLCPACGGADPPAPDFFVGELT